MAPISSLFSNFSTIQSNKKPLEELKGMCRDRKNENSFFILSIDELVHRVKHWRSCMPRVDPHYAVKCNSNDAVVQTLALLGTGFDCASKQEIKQVLSLGVPESRIIFANPIKTKQHLLYAKKHGVKRMTFDSETELIKISEHFPSAEILLRIRCDAENAQCPLGMKYGVNPEEVTPLLTTAKKLNLTLVGVAFHVGSGCSEPTIFHKAIAEAKAVFQEAKSFGHSPYILDIGGGFLGDNDSLFREAADHINGALDCHFPEGCGVTVIAEPGRYMVAAAFTLATQIIGHKDEVISASDIPDDIIPAHSGSDSVQSRMYYTDDGVYGSFNCVLYDHQVVKPIPLFRKEQYATNESMMASIWGQTCDGFDQIIKAAYLPKLDMGDWFIWKNMGAYTISAAGSFNGFQPPKVIVHVHPFVSSYLESKLQEGSDNFGTFENATNVKTCMDESERQHITSLVDSLSYSGVEYRSGYSSEDDEASSASGEM